MYTSKYYTVEQIDQRLLQGYYDDFVNVGFAGTINEFWAFVLSIANKVNKKEGYDLSKNDFTDELKKKLDEVEEKANYITKLSQLENDTKYQTEEQVKQSISDLIDGADDALDTLKELAEALGNDPNFATTITNKLTDLRNALTEEVNRAKEAENKLESSIRGVNDNFIKAVDLLNDKIDKVQVALVAEINRVEVKVDKNTSDIASLKSDVTGNLLDAKAYAKDLVDAEAESRRAADEKITDDIHELSNNQTRDKAELKADIAAEAQTRTNADVVLNSKLSEEITNRQTAVASVESKLAEEVVNRRAADETIQNSITKEIADRTNADNALQGNIDKEAQSRESGDQILQSNIDSEAATRLAQDQILDHKIEDLASKGTSDKQEALDAIAAEREARIAADAALDEKKVDKREGYALSKNDLTDILLKKLNDIEEKANYITRLSQLINDSGYQTQAEVEESIQKIIGSAPEVLDTLEEIAKALGDDPNFATTITKKLAAITEKVNQEVLDRTAADTVLQANLDKEVVERKEADTALEARVKGYTDNEIEKVNLGTDTITNQLTQEIADRKAADTVLQANIDKEAADRKAADTVHDTAIVNANKRITELALSLQDAINTVKNELTSQVNANTIAIATNAANIQKNTESIAAVTKSVEDNYKEVKDMINEEIVDRTNADSSLSSRIDNTNIALGTETAERKAASEILQTNLNKEIGDRQLAIDSTKTEFDSKLSNLSQTVSSEITRVDEKITREVSDRIAGDKTLSDRIDTLEGSSSTGLNELKVKVDANTTAINTEKDRATTRENTIQSNLDTAIANHKDELNGIIKDISDEANARIAADAALQVNIDKEVTDRKNADTLINNALAQEVSDRITAIQGLESKKVDKVDGKGLSSNDFTDLLFVKLQNIEDKANYITQVSQLLNDSGFQTEAEVNAAIEKIIGSAPEVLNTLEEIAKALGDDPNFATTITNKLSDFEKDLAAEVVNREKGDTNLQTSLNTLSTTLNKTVDDLRTYVTETRAELIARANSQDALITQNSSNIQRNLELIQGIQNNISGSYLEVKALLETEIQARKSEDTRLEGLINQGQLDLATETADRKAADKALQDNLDAEAIVREAADKALGVRIDTETSERKAADTLLTNNLATETSERKAADTALGTRIDNEVTARTNADKKLTDDLAAEVTARTNADKALSDRVDDTNAHTINGYRLDSDPVLDAEDLVLNDDYNYSRPPGADIYPDKSWKGDSLQTAVEKITYFQGFVLEYYVPSLITSIEQNTGLEIDGSDYEHVYQMPDLSATKYLGGSTTIIDGLKKLDTVLKTLNDSNDEIWKVLYNQFTVISGFAVSPTIAEKGVNTQINISGQFLFNSNPLMPEYLTLRKGNDLLSSTPVANLSGTKDVLNTTDDVTTYTISITSQGVTKRTSATVRTYYPMYFGNSIKVVLNSADVLGFTKQAIKASAAGSYSMNVEQGRYVWLCVPSTFNISKVTSGGFEVPMEAPVNVTVDGKGTYKCYRSSGALNAGTFNFVIG